MPFLVYISLSSVYSCVALSCDAMLIANVDIDATNKHEPTPTDSNPTQTEWKFTKVVGNDFSTSPWHMRECCDIHSFPSDCFLHCSNCVCHVCETPSSQCPVWQYHCNANYLQDFWLTVRDLRKQYRGMRVEKEFNGTLYQGTVMEVWYDVEDNSFVYRVIYDDSDGEDYSLAELLSIIL